MVDQSKSRVTDGKVHDVNISDEIMPQPGAFDMVDRGYIAPLTRPSRRLRTLMISL